MNEADTCRKYVVPKLQEAGWEDEPHCVAEQRYFTNKKGSIRIIGGKIVRGQPKRADYLLGYRVDYPIAVVEAKADYKSPGAGLSQAKEYASILKLKFAYATNGTGIVEFDFITGEEKEVERFPTPEQLWDRLRGKDSLPEEQKEILLYPCYFEPDFPLRYYQKIAINRAMEGVLRGDSKLLITMATGTGKTLVAFQICYKLWYNRWNRSKDPVRRPKILYLADRNILVDDPKDKRFVPFGEARHKIENGEVVKSREMYFAIYQSIAKDKRRPGLYKEYAPDFFDLIVVDECHRGSARDDSNWREILDYFESAVQIGMTATPLRKDNKATYRYFGNPIYQYSLKEGLGDGFLAPYRVHRVVTSADAAGWRPTKGELDKLGREIPDEEYHTPDFERRLSLRPRSEAIARHLTNFLKRTNRMDRTIIFCVDQEHADEMRGLLSNLNKDLVKINPNYVCRVTSDEGDIGKGHLSAFQELEADDETPVILTTSKLLSTGVDAQMVKNVVLIRIIGTMTEFKQIIGRGTRLREDYGKYYFNILDYTGTATRHFTDPEFDGDPEFISEEEIDEEGNVIESTVIAGDGEEPEEGEGGGDEESSLPYVDSDPGAVIFDPPSWNEDPKKLFVERGSVDIAAHITLDIAADGKQLRVTEFRDYTGDFMRSYFSGADDFRSAWSQPGSRHEIWSRFADKGINIQEAGVLFGNPDADPFDILCNIAWNTPVMTRAERAARVRKNQPDFFARHGEKAREILNALLDKYAAYGPSEFAIPESLKVPPLSDLGNVSEIISLFGDAEQFLDAVIELQEILYAA